MSKINESQEHKICSLFNTAKDEIDKINHYADKKKKEIVIKLAEQLEKHVRQTDTISSLIVKQLCGKVSPTFIRECLPAKYKQGIRSENAKHKRRLRETNLATLPLLKQKEEEKKQKNKQVITIGFDNQTNIQRENDNEPIIKSEDPPTLKGRSFSQPTYQSQKEQEQFLETPSQFAISNVDKIMLKEISTSSESLNDNYKDFLPFEFHLSRRDVQSYLDSIEPNSDDDVWFNGTIDLKTGEVISAYIKSQQHVAEKSRRNDIATVDLVNE